MDKQTELTATQKLLKLVAENPDLPILPMVHGEMCEDDSHYWAGEIKSCEVNEYIVYEFDWGESRIIFKDDTEDVYSELYDQYYSEVARETISERERDEYAESRALADIEAFAWKKAIILYIA